MGISAKFVHRHQSLERVQGNGTGKVSSRIFQVHFAWGTGLFPVNILFPKRFISFCNVDISTSATLIFHLAYAVLYFVPTTFITPCAVGPPTLVLLNNMSSHIYRNLRFGFYKDYTTRSSVINRALEGSGQDSQNQGDLDGGSDRDLESSQ